MLFEWFPNFLDFVASKQFQGKSAFARPESLLPTQIPVGGESRAGRVFFVFVLGLFCFCFVWFCFCRGCLVFRLWADSHLKRSGKAFVITSPGVRWIPTNTQRLGGTCGLSIWRSRSTRYPKKPKKLVKGKLSPHPPVVFMVWFFDTTAISLQKPLQRLVVLLFIPQD